MKRALATIAAATLVIGVGFVAVPAAHADDANPAFSSYGADASATGIHVLSYTNGLTNFATGFLDNSFPLANTHIDAGPASQAVASVGDSGPLGATGQGVAQDPCAQTSSASPQCYAIEAASPVPIPLIEQPQYAVARYPGAASASQSQAGSIADAVADENSASAHSAYVAGTANDARSSVKVDQVTGSVLGQSSSHVDQIVFGDGMLDIRGVDVSAQVQVVGDKVTPHYDINVASVTVNGMPVKVTDKGVVVGDAPQPGSDVVTQTANEQLNAALASSGLVVTVTPPQITTDTGQATVAVSGLHVHYTAPNPDPSVPTFTADFIVGEARAFSFGVPGVSLESESPVEPTLPELTSTVEGTSLGSASGAVSELAPEVGRATLRPPNTLRAAPASYRRPRATWLVPIYLVWQAIVLMTGLVLVWSRRELT